MGVAVDLRVARAGYLPRGSGVVEPSVHPARVDRHLADMLVIFAALAHGTTTYMVPRSTEHSETNLWLVEKFRARTSLEGQRVRIEGIGL